MLETPATPQNEDLDKADRNDKWRFAAWILALLLVGAITWILMAQGSNAKNQALSEASQKFTLAQQVAAACAVKEQADDLGGLCASATQIVKEGPNGIQGIQGPPGDVGPQGPLGPKGEQGPLGAQGIFGKPGADGAVGEPGINGATGAVGADGTTGAVGADGTPGAIGPTGAPGADSGVAGPQGDPGINGLDGASGQSAFPFSFTFTAKDQTFTCDITAPNVVTGCVETP